MEKYKFLTKCINIPEPENRCHICCHYNMTYEFCHLQNIFGYCDFKPIHNKEQINERRNTADN